MNDANISRIFLLKLEIDQQFDGRAGEKKWKV